MYGLVNRAVEQLVIQHRGAAGWSRVCMLAGIEEDGFVAAQSYPDDLTYRLVGAASKELNLPAEQVLEAFGEYWILYTAEEGYGDFLDSAGDNLRTFLINLDHMHSRIESVLSEMVLPSFSVTDESENQFLVHYRSPRQGLAPMVVGLIKGLAKRLGQQIEIEHVQHRTEQLEDIFRVQVLA